MTVSKWITCAVGAIAIAALGVGVFALQRTNADPAPLPAPVAAQSTPDSALDETDRAILHAEIRRYLLENPEIIMDVINVLEARGVADAQAAERQMLRELAGPLFNDGYSFVDGNPDGDVVMVEFIDYQCTFCKRAHPEVASLLANDGNIRLIIKEFPILGPVSDSASRAAMAVLNEQGPELYKEFADQMMRFPGRLDENMIDRLAERSGVDVEAMRAGMNSRAIDRQLEQNKLLAQQLDITGTPTFVLGDSLIRGYLPEEQMMEAVRLTRSAAR